MNWFWNRHKPPSTVSLAVVVITYNVRKYVEQAVDSVLGQTRAPDQVVVIDDGSTDGTRELLQARYDGRIELVTQKNGGPGAARNRGIAAAKADYLLFLDGDDWLRPDALARLERKLLAEPGGLDIVFSNRSYHWDGSGRDAPSIVFSDKAAAGIKRFPEVLKIHAIHGKLYRRRFLKRHRLSFPTGMSSEDFVFSYSTYARATSVASVAAVTYTYRKRNDAANRSFTQDRLSDFNLQSRFRQIDLTLAALADGELQRRFPKAQFEAIEYRTRLMRHIEHLPAVPPDVRQRAFGAIRTFCQTHRPGLEAHTQDDVHAIYDAILDDDLPGTLELLADRRERRRQHVSNGRFADPQPVPAAWGGSWRASPLWPALVEEPVLRDAQATLWVHGGRVLVVDVPRNGRCYAFDIAHGRNGELAIDFFERGQALQPALAKMLAASGYPAGEGATRVRLAAWPAAPADPDLAMHASRAVAGVVSHLLKL